MFKYFLNHYYDKTDVEWWNDFRTAMQAAADLVEGDAHIFAIEYGNLLEREMVRKWRTANGV